MNSVTFNLFLKMSLFVLKKVLKITIRTPNNTRLSFLVVMNLDIEMR